MWSQFSLTLPMRDGLKLQGYLTLPGPREGAPYPLVALVHGGPWARDIWGFDPEVQFLASRGYAVLQFNFRGSEGFGLSKGEAFAGDFRGMVDDVADATRQLVAGGLADPRRLAIMGASFGGYAAAAAAAFHPDLYSCAVSISGFFDLEEQIDQWKTRFWKDRQGTWAYDQWVEALGDPETNAERHRALSPRYHADKIGIPMLLIHGTSDTVVSDSQTKDFARALRRADNKPETLYLRWEAHGAAQLKNRVKTYEAVEEFLKENL